MKTKRVEFKPPDDFFLPEGAGTNEDFDLVCTLRIKKDGKLCLVKLGDVEMPGYEDDEDENESRPQYGQARQMMTGES